jgi:hypothetical protein
MMHPLPRCSFARREWARAHDTHHGAKGVGRRSIHLFRVSTFIRGLMADIDTLLPERALVANRQSLQLSTSL